MDRHDEHEKDLEIERMFEAAREADREAAPAFRQIVAQGHLERHQHERPRARGMRFVWMASASTVAVVALAAWLGTHAPPAPVPPPVISNLPEVPPPVAALQKVERSMNEQGAALELPRRVDGKADVEKALQSLGYVAGPSAPEPQRSEPEQSIEDHPLPGRFYQDVLTLAPGAQDAGAARPVPQEARDRDVLAERVTVQSGSDVVDLEQARGVPQAAPRPNVHGARERDFKAVDGGVVGGVLGGIVGDVPGGEPGSAPARMEKLPARFSRSKVAPEERAETAPEFNTESYGLIEENRFLETTENPLSTFSIDVDTASYANVRRFLNQGQRPPRDAVRIEELVNYFRYDYPGPAGREPFGASIEIAECPWNVAHRLARIGLKGREIDRGRREPSSLVFLLDVSGSMNQPNKLPLLQASLGLLVDELDDRDRVAIVVYAGASGLVLPSTSGSSRGEIRAALARLSAGGSTNGGEGLRLAYETARQNFVRGGTNRVILATDGDFNVGVTSQAELLSLIEDDARRGIFLTALGFGMGNYQDSTLEMLADKGNGNYAYIDDLREARKVLVEELTGTLVTIAKDVKIQVEFNPAEVGAYRLIGYENRMLRKEDFNDDRKDAGEIGAGHTVTALYEIVPASARRDVDLPSVDPLRYQQGPALTESARRGELFTLKLRYKEPEGERSRLLEFPAVDAGARRGSPDFEFAAAVAGFGMLLRGSEQAGDFTYRDVRELAAGAIGRSEGREYRREFAELVSRAASLD